MGPIRIDFKPLLVVVILLSAFVGWVVIELLIWLIKNVGVTFG
jgi:hypothetical protein